MTAIGGIAAGGLTLTQFAQPSTHAAPACLHKGKLQIRSHTLIAGIAVVSRFVMCKNARV